MTHAGVQANFLDFLDENSPEVIPQARPPKNTGSIQEQAGLGVRASAFWWIESPELYEEHDTRHLCSTCRRINFKALLREAAKETKLQAYEVRDMSVGSVSIVLGPLSEILRKTTCNFCRLVARAICIEGEVEVPRTESAGSPVVVELQSSTCTTGLIEQGQRIDVPVLGIFLDPWIDIRPAFLREGNPIPSTEADVNTLKTWLRSCESSHTEAHVSVEERPSPDMSHFRLVDIEHQRIIKANEQCRYIALSYVWGSTKQFQNTRSICRDLEEEGGLSSEDGRLSQVIRDAIYLVAQMGERYLWVDALCIVQDDPISKHSQIAAMDKIYTSAILTVVAAAGDNANAGLPGVRLGRRHAPQHVEKVQETLLVTTLPSMSDVVDDSTWNHRAWTFQERVLSCRMLIFAAQQVYFSCTHGYCWEEAMHRAEDAAKATPPPNTVHARVDLYGVQPQQRVNFDSYLSAVYWYTSRKLSYDYDVLNAFSGIMAFLRPYMRSKFLYGLPETELDTALLWQPHNAAHRRKDSITGETLFPSWSWAGWIGKISHSATSFDLLSVPRVKWVDTSLDSTRDNTFSADEYRAEAKETSASEEPWYRGQSKAEGRFYYFQSTKPDAWFLHPTAREERRKFRSRLKPNTACLQFYALTARFKITGWHMPNTGVVGARACKGDRHTICPLAIYDDDDYVVGTMNVPASIAGQIEPGNHEFICLSRSAKPGDIVRLDLPPPRDDFKDLPPGPQSFPDEPPLEESHQDFDCQRCNPRKQWCLYNVMMVEWRGENASRVGLGTIHVDAFLLAQPQERLISLE